MTLGTYLERATQTPAGHPDLVCASFAADWLVACGYDDPIAPLRGTEGQALKRSIARAGSILGLADQMALAARLVPTETPVAGDIGVIEFDTGDGANQVLAIFTGQRWLVRTTNGLAAMPTEPLAAWRVHHG